MPNAPTKPGPGAPPDEGTIAELPDPTEFSELFVSRYLHAADLKGNDATLKIIRVALHELDDEKHPGEKKRMGVLYFEGKKKGLGLNRTNAACLKEMWGSKPQDWVGKRVTLYPTTVRMPSKVKGGGMVTEPCIRVRGSPDIAAEIAFTLTLPKKGPQRIVLVKMQPKGAAAQAPAAAAPAASDALPPPGADPFA